MTAGGGFRFARVPRTLLVAGVEPGGAHVGEQILRDFAGAFPDRTLAGVALHRPQGAPRRDPGDAGIPLLRLERPGPPVRAPVLGPLGPGPLTYARSKSMRALLGSAISFAREFGAEQVWVVLESGAAMVLGHRIAEALQVPLVAQVWDPPDHALLTEGIDRATRRVVMRHFARAVERSERVAVVTDAMGEVLADRYGADPVLVRQGITAGRGEVLTGPPADDGSVRIGFAGSLYARDAWQGLLRALDAREWRLGGKCVRIDVMGNRFPFAFRGPAEVRLLGYRPESEVSGRLRACDLLYLPYPFADDMRDLARLSFPTKMSSYLAAGRPVIVHAPPYASIVEFQRTRGVGVAVTTPDPEEVAAALDEFVTDAAALESAAGAARRTALAEFGREAVLARFATFIGAELPTAGPT